VSVRVGRAPDVPPEPAVRFVAEELRQDLPAPTRAQLHAPGLVGLTAAVPGRADRHVLDAVAVEIAGTRDHASEELAGLRPGPVT
jgi:hypothetical protein